MTRDLRWLLGYDTKSTDRKKRVGSLNLIRMRTLVHQRRMKKPPPRRGKYSSVLYLLASLSKSYRHVLLLDSSPAQKWAEFEQTFLQRRYLYLNGQLAHKKMLNIISH